MYIHNFHIFASTKTKEMNKIEMYTALTSIDFIAGQPYLVKIKFSDGIPNASSCLASNVNDTELMIPVCSVIDRHIYVYDTFIKCSTFAEFKTSCNELIEIVMKRYLTVLCDEQLKIIEITENIMKIANTEVNV